MSAQTPAIDLDQMTQSDLAALLQWYVAMGVDGGVDETPHDRFAESAAAETARAAAREAAKAAAEAPKIGRVAPKPATLTAAPASPAAVGADEAVRAARALAAGAHTLDALKAALEAYEGCALKRTASRLVFGDGNPQARVMIVGEAPGADEDRQGVPFVGKAGRLLDVMLKAIKLDRTSVYIANVVPWRPPGNRTPTPQETAACLPFVLRQIALVNPDLVLCLGNASAQTLLNLKDGITKTRGHWMALRLEDGRVVKALPSLHPAYLLRSPGAKRYVWRDLRALRKALDGVQPGTS